MVIDIKMCRFENVPWGFRLVGGSDFEFPLTVVKVTEGSIAESAGLMVGDVIVRINDTAASPLTHDETNKIIKGCGNVFFFGVQRENEEEYTTPKAFPVAERVSSPKSFLEARAGSVTPPVIVDTPNEEKVKVCEVDYMADLEERPCSVLSEETERKLVEEEIAAVLSGESEVLQEHNTMGIFPKPGVCMSSDVLRTLNEEATKTKAEKDKENRKWTTFLQKPDRPIPKSKQQIEAERRAANAYKVKIVRGSTISRSVSPAPPPKPVEEVKPPKEPTPPPVVEPEPEPEPEPEAPTPVDTEVPNLEETSTNNNEKPQQLEEEAEKTDKEKETIPEAKEIEETDKATNEEETSESTPANANEEKEETKSEAVIEKTEEELALERQLADVQKQLAALSSLPSTIQSTLDAVTKQLADILPTFKLQQEQPRKLSGSVAREISLEKISENAENEDPGNDENKDIKENDNVAEKCHESVDNVSSSIGNQDPEQKQDNKANEQIANDTNEARDTIDKNPIKQQEAATKYNTRSSNEETLQMEEEQKLKKQKKYDVIEELEEHLERKSNPKRSKRAFGPLTPASDRPLVLPGGRRWYRPKDAYNDEFIAETLSAQAELITGTTLGVNFMKYQKPEKKIDLNRSEVYKVIHHLDRQPVRGIEVRPPVVPAEVDIRKSLHS
ncbi:translation initiation factor IF-2 isoform X2 [Lucilia sericata]|uniref:translation initiation factor IF-2 isoform X2 n=1 Tax=Lucilia sericata TaxID=13632 RepID=UPI0018A80430|nr:translation initiation factor IF-2 isoform X2 [Lucilia sericata]